MKTLNRVWLMSMGLACVLGMAQPSTRPAGSTTRPAGSTTRPAGSTLPPAGPVNDHTAFDAILREVVKGERVDYGLLKERHLPALDAYIAGFVDVGAPRQPLADYLNLYNAVMLRAVVEKRDGDPEWKPSDGDFAVFKEPRVPLKDGRVSLDHLEHEIIRKKYREPRIHAALNCAAVSCPPLQPAAFTTQTLDAVLEEAMRAFINDGQRNVFLGRMQTMRLSRIFDWFAADFGGRDRVPDYLLKYRPLNKGNYRGWKVEFLEYDWNLNEVR